jgi:hypothetical protein
MINVSEIIGIHGVPRSGTSWLGQIFNSHPQVAFRFQPLFSYAFKSYLNLNSSKDEMDNFFEQIFLSDDYFINMKDSEIHKNYPVFQKNPQPQVLMYKEVRYHYLIPHLLKHHESVKFIFIIRNPFSVLTSWAKAPREFKPEWNFNDEWKNAQSKNQNKPEEYFGFDKWKEASQLFFKCKKNFPDHVQIISYNELLKNTIPLIERLFEFSGLLLDKQSIDFINKSRKQNHEDPNSVFKIKLEDNGWKNFIPENIIRQVHDELKESELAKFLD